MNNFIFYILKKLYFPIQSIFIKLKIIIMQLKMWLLLVTGIIPLITGFLWYNKATFGNSWMKANGFIEETMKSGNILVLYGIAYVFGCMLSLGLMPAVIHQMGFDSVFQGDATPEAATYMKNFFETYGTRFRTFKHGAFHGVLTAIFVALPILGTIALFERRGAKYIAIHVGYWAITMALMGGIICAYL
jgi:Protein of unknown function (DUF1761)